MNELPQNGMAAGDEVGFGPLCFTLFYFTVIVDGSAKRSLRLGTDSGNIHSVASILIRFLQLFANY